MKILIVGSGGREHAIAWKLLQSPKVTCVICTPGNGGTAIMDKCHNIPISIQDHQAIAQTARANQCDLVIIGPELPLAQGIVDYLQTQQIPVFGPTAAGAMIESSKAYAKELMLQANIPTAHSAVFTNLASAKTHVLNQGAPIVIKADGLAAGKGVTVAMSITEALEALTQLYQTQPDQKVVIEEYLIGQEVSILALTDGKTIIPLLPAQDHKRIGEQDTGANTGGMGAYAPTPIITNQLNQQIQQKILEPTLKALQTRGIDYRGIIYTGLMINPNGTIQVLEYNCRLGDPETQAILPLLDTPLEDLLLACLNQTLDQLPPIPWKSSVSICVVISSRGYPTSSESGQIITGIEQIDPNQAIVFHAGTELSNSQLLTKGGRVLGIVATAETYALAKEQVYQAINNIHFDGMYYRKDIAHRVINQ